MQYPAVAEILKFNRRVYAAARVKAEAAYGADIGRKLRSIVSHLGQNPGEVEYAAITLDMELAVALDAIAALNQQVQRYFEEGN